MKRLPDPLRKDLEERLKTFQAGKSSLDQVMSWLEGHAALFGIDATELPSRSALHRYSQNFEVIVQRVQRARELTELIAEQSGPTIADGNGVEVVIQLVQSLTYEMLGNLEEGTALDPKAIHDLAKAAHHMAAAQKTNADRALKVEAETLRKAAAAAKAVGRELGWSAETAATVRERILGLGKKTGAP